MKNGEYRSKLRSIPSCADKEFDPAPFLLNQTAAHVLESLAFAQEFSHIGKSFCQDFLTVAQEGFKTSDAAIQTDSLALVVKVAAATDSDDIRAEVLSLLRAQFNNRNGDVAQTAQKTYDSLQTEKNNVKSQQHAASHFPTLSQHT